MNILFISNGEAEDAIAVSLIRHWLYLKKEDRVAALAICGTGKNYKNNDIPLINTPFYLPSNGFAYQSWYLLYKDIEAGLISAMYSHYKALKRISEQVDYVVGVGDIVPVIAAYLLGKPNSFVGCAMSDYYTQGTNKSSYSYIKRKLLLNMNTLVFPRDLYTTNGLQKYGLRCVYQGNPMIDCIEYNKNLNLEISKNDYVIGVLPGSHDDCRNNFRSIMSILSNINKKEKYVYLVAVADKDNIPKFGKDLSTLNWFIKKSDPKHAIWKNNRDETIHLLNGYFGNVLMSSHVIVGTSGTGNEQAAGIGIPIISFPCGKIQYTKRFGLTQQKLLSKTLNFIPNSNPSPDLFKKYLDKALNDAKYREEVRKIAIERFGDFGASERITHKILNTINISYG